MVKKLLPLSINYAEEHYKQALSGLVADEDIEKMAKANLERMGAL